MPSRNKKTASFLFLLYCFPLSFLLALATRSVHRDIPIAVFTRDPAATADIPPLSGVSSHFGVLLLTASGAICLFSWFISTFRSNPGKSSSFLFYSGCMSLILALDDLLMLHESLYPRVLGVNEKIVFLVYGLLILGGIIRFRKEILQSEYLILLIAFCFFGISIFIDLSDGFHEYSEATIWQWQIFLEDGFKLLGIVSWFGYFLKCSLVVSI